MYVVSHWPTARTVQTRWQLQFLQCYKVFRQSSHEYAGVIKVTHLNMTATESMPFDASTTLSSLRSSISATVVLLLLVANNVPLSSFPGPCKTDFSGSKIAKMMDDIVVTMNCGMTTKILWMPYHAIMH